MYSTGYFTITCRAPTGVDWHFPDEKAEEIATTGGRFRGEVINELIHLEHKIELLLARYFCPNKTKQQFFLWNLLRGRVLQFKNKTTILFSLLKDELAIDPSVAKGHLTELATIRNRLAHADAVYDVSTDTLHFVYRSGEYKVGDAFKGEIDSKVKAVDEFLNGLLLRPEFSEP